MTPEQMTAIGALLAVLLGGGGIGTLFKIRADRKAGVKGGEREARRDMIADRDGLIETLFTQTASQQGYLEAMDTRVRALEADKSFLTQIRDAYSDHIDSLEAFVWAVHRGDAQPPPPARPIVARKEQANG